METLRPHKELGIDLGAYSGALGVLTFVVAAMTWTGARVLIAPYAHVGLVLILAGAAALFFRVALLRFAAQHDDILFPQISVLERILYWGALTALSVSLLFAFVAFLASLRHSSLLLAFYGALSLLGPVLAIEIHRRTKRKSRHG